MRINKRVLRTDKDYMRIDFKNVAEGLFLTFWVIVMIVVVTSICVPIVRKLVRKPGPPPKVITKIVKQSALSEAQQEFIDACKDSGEYSSQPNVPDVHATKWTCTNP